MDCDDVELLLARGGVRTLPGREAGELDSHVATCASCRELTTQAADDSGRWIARVPEDALDDADLLVLPTIDPGVYAGDQELARGGMGRITRVRDRRLGREVAIKEVLDPAMRARFEREVAITAQLQHPAIVPIYEAGTWPDGSPFYSMRLVSGGTLADAIAGTEAFEQRLALLPHVLALTDALAYAHSRGVVHRDLKPGNVLVGEFGETLVIDWGLAKELHRDIDDDDKALPATAQGRELTRAGSVLGTPGFMAPEQAAGGSVDERADVYALGAILYNVLAGQMPYAGHEGDQLIERARREPPVPIAMLAPEIPLDLCAIVERAMARDPAARFATAKQMADELRRFQAGQLLTSRAYTMRELVVRWARRHRAVVLASAVALAVIAAVGVGAIINITRSRTAAEQARARAEAGVTTLLEEQGRAELAAGEPERAATVLAEAYRRGDSSVALRHMVAAATRDLELRGATINAGTFVKTLGYRSDGSLVIVDAAGTSIWENGKRMQTHPFAARAAAGWTTFLAADSSAVAVVTADRHAQLYDVASGALVWTIDATNDSFVVFDRTGSRFAHVILSRPTELRDTKTGALLASLPSTDSPLAVAFSDDGSQIAICTRTGGDLVIADARTGKEQSRQPGCWHRVGFLDDGRIVVQTTARALQVWSTNGDASARTSLAGNLDEITSLAVSNHAKRIIATDATRTMLMWLTTGALVATTPTVAMPASFSPDGSLVAARGVGEPLRIWHTDALQLAHTVHVPDERPYSSQEIVWSPDGAHMAAMPAVDPRVFTYVVTGNARILRDTGARTAIASDVLLSDAGDWLQLVSIASGEVIARLPTEYSTAKIEDLSRDGRRAVLLADREARVIDTHRGAVVSSFALDGDLEDAQLSADGNIVLLTARVTTAPSHQAVALQLRSATTGSVIRALSFSGDLALSPTGDRLALTSDSGVEILDTASGKTLAHVGFDRMPGHVTFDRDGKRLIGYGAMTHPRIVDATTGRLLTELGKPSSELECVSFDASGDRVITWGDDRAAELWNARTGELLATIDGVAFCAIAISPDGLRVATAIDDGTIEILDVTTLRRIDTLPVQQTGIDHLAWNGDGTRLVARASDTGVTTVWDVHLETRSPQAIAALVARTTGWQFAGGRLVPMH